MEFLVECIEAVREEGSSKEHYGLTAVLREASTRTLHPDADDRLGRCLGDSGADGIVAFLRLYVLHTTQSVLTVNVGDGALEFRARRRGPDRREARTHASKDACGSVLFLLDGLAPCRREDLRLTSAGALDGIRGLLHVLGNVKSIDELHGVARPVGGQPRLDRVERAPLRLGTVACEDDVELGPLAQHARQLIFQFTDKCRLVRLGHAGKVDRSQTYALGVEKREGAYRGLVPRATHRAVLGARFVTPHRTVAPLMSWWLWRLRLAAPRLRVLSVLRHHHAVQTRLHRNGFVGNDVTRAHGRRDDGPIKFVAH